MTNKVVPLETSYSLLTEKIKEAQEPYIKEKELPKRNSDLVRLYQQKAARNYDVDRSKNDIENAVELLSIAYSATPQKAGDVRVRIADIHQNVLKSQEKAETMMKKVASDAEDISEELIETFSELQDFNDEDKKAYIVEDFSELVEKIEKKASTIYTGLMEVAGSFDNISKETLEVSKASQLLLGDEMKEREKVEKAISGYEAQQASLENLLDSLRKSIEKYNEQARKMEEKADTADKRAFITGLIQIGAQALASVAGTVAMSLGGPASMATRVATSTFLRDGTKQENTGGGSNDAKSDVDPAKLETKKAGIKLKKDEAETKVGKLEEEMAKLTTQIEKLKKNNADLQTEKAELEDLERNLREKEQESERARQELKELGTQLGELSKTASEVRGQELDAAKSFRQLQVDFLDKAEKYEKEKMTQDAELIRIKSLLGSQSTVKNSIELTIETLILSVKALQQVKSILEEVAAFFKNFAEFLQGVSKQAQQQSEKISKATSKERYWNGVLKGIDEFMISQCAEWYATENIANRFVDAFNSGWEMMNNLSGKYLDEQELKVYIGTAANRIEEIAKSREAASTAKITDINKYRQDIEAQDAV
jgi:chromosome segregation ATPase